MTTKRRRVTNLVFLACMVAPHAAMGAERLNVDIPRVSRAPELADFDSPSPGPLASTSLAHVSGFIQITHLHSMFLHSTTQHRSVLYSTIQYTV